LQLRKLFKTDLINAGVLEPSAKRVLLGRPRKQQQDVRKSSSEDRAL
jgi:hypothetical protein